MLEYLFDSEWRQRTDIESLKKAATYQQQKLKRDKEKSSEVVHKLREKVLRMELVQAAMLRMLQQSKLWNEEEFRNIMTELDLKDGKLDGKMTPKKKPLVKSKNAEKTKKTFRV